MRRDRLRFLYGCAGGDDAADRLQRLLDRYRHRLPQRPARSFDERSVLLITYGDTFVDPARRPLRVLAQFAARHLGGLVSGVHVLPFFPSSSDYGFSVIDYERVDPSLGTWADVGALHDRFELMVDFVLNHVSAESAWFAGFRRGSPRYRRFFVTADPAADLSSVTRPRTSPLLTRVETSTGERWVWTTFSADQIDLDYAEPAVLLRMVEVMLRYVERGADLLRLDAVGYLWKELGTPCIHLPQTHEIVKLLREVLDEVAPHVALVTETNVPHADNVAYFGNGHDEAQMVYQFPLGPLVLDAFRRADGTRLARWASGLATPSSQTAFFNFLASHDGIGVVPARGLLPDADVDALVRQTRAHGGEVSARANPDGSESPYELNVTFFDALSDPYDRREPWRVKRDRFLCAQAIMLALAGVPGVYVHSLFGSHNDHAGYERSGWKRDLNHARLPVAALEAELADPTSEKAQVFAGMRALLAARRGHPAFHPAAPQEVFCTDGPVLALRRGPREGRGVVALHNLDAAPQVVDLARLGLASGPHRDLVRRGEVAHGELRLGAYEVRWLNEAGDP
ncbi:MAG: sugar phosphorylase [bacterium]|jgi:sucrose phosphorylase|nr:sugar phosphorylase [bacterium]